MKTNNNSRSEDLYEEIAQALKDEGLGDNPSLSSEQAPGFGGDSKADDRPIRVTLLKAREAANYLRISLFTLKKMEKEGKLVPFRTPGGHRRYSLQMLNEYLERSRRARLPTESRPTKSD